MEAFLLLMSGWHIQLPGSHILMLLYRFCIDNGIMIAQAGLLAHRMGFETDLEDSTCTQRYVVMCQSTRTALSCFPVFEQTKSMLHGEPKSAS